MDRVFSAGEIADEFCLPPAIKLPSSSPGKESSKMNRSESEWAFQRFLQEASAAAASQTSLPPGPASSSSSSKPEKNVIEVKDGKNPETDSFNFPPANFSTDSDDYQAFLKSRLSLACAAVALTRGSLGKSQISAALANNGSQDSSTTPLDCQAPSQGSGHDLSELQAKEVSGPLIFPSLPTTQKKSGVQVMQTSGSSRDFSDDDEAEGETETIGHMVTADAKRVRRMLSNRESARRSRRRKQAHLTELEAEVVQLRVEKSSLLKRLDDLSQKHNEAAVDNRVLKADVETLGAKVTMAEEMVKRVMGLTSVFEAMPKASSTSAPSFDGIASNASTDVVIPVQDGTKPQIYRQPAPITSTPSLKPTVMNGLADISSVKNTQQHPAVAAATTGSKMGRTASIQRVASLERLQKQIRGGPSARGLQCGGGQ